MDYFLLCVRDVQYDSQEGTSGTQLEKYGGMSFLILSCNSGKDSHLSRIVIINQILEIRLAAEKSRIITGGQLIGLVSLNLKGIYRFC